MNPSKAAIVAAITEQFRARLDARFAAIEQSAADTAEDSDKPPMAAFRFAATWPAGAINPTVKTALAFGKPIKDEAELEVDPDQAKLPLGGEV